MDFDKIKIYVFGVSLVIIISVLFIALFSINLEENTSVNLDSISTSSDSVYTAPTTLTAEQGITSSEVKAYNQTWLDFDGVNDKISLPDLLYTLNVSNNFSVSGWFKINSDSDGFILSSSSSFHNRITITAQNDIIKFGTYNGSTYSPTSSDFISADTWIYLTAIHYSNMTNILYLNNILQSGINGSSNPGSSYNSYIGSSTDGSSGFFNGSIDEVRIYNKELTLTEVQEIYNSSRQANSSLPSDGLVLWYSFDENNGTIVHDKSGNGYDGV